MARTRSDKTTREVLDAARAVLLDVGVARFSVDAVVAHSGVAKTTIYRWWPSRQALLLDAIHAQLTPPPTPNTGDTRADLRTYLDRFTRLEPDTPATQLLPDLCAAAQRDHDLAELRDILLAEKRQPILTILELARARGELRADADLDLLATLVVGPLVYSKSMRGIAATPALVDAAIDAALEHGRARPAA